MRDTTLLQFKVKNTALAAVMQQIPVKITTDKQDNYSFAPFQKEQPWYCESCIHLDAPRGGSLAQWFVDLMTDPRKSFANLYPYEDRKAKIAQGIEKKGIAYCDERTISAEIEICNICCESGEDKLTVITALPIVFGAEMRYYEIVGKAKTDNTLELSIQERRFSDEELFLATENVYLKYITSGKKATVHKKQYVKLLLEAYNKRSAIEVPAVLMEDGRLAIDAKPYRAISDFSCVVGDDKKGYEIILPKNITPCKINHEGKTVYVDSDLEADYLGLKAIWSSLGETVQYIRTRNKKLRERALITITGNNIGEIPERYLSELFIAEFFYQLLFSVDDLHHKVNDPSFAQYIVDNATYKRDGTSIYPSNKFDYRTS